MSTVRLENRNFTDDLLHHFFVVVIGTMIGIMVLVVIVPERQIIKVFFRGVGRGYGIGGGDGMVKSRLL